MSTVLEHEHYTLTDTPAGFQLTVSDKVAKGRNRVASVVGRRIPIEWVVLMMELERNGLKESL